MTQTFTSGQVLTAEATNAELAFPTGSMFPFAGATAPAVTIGGVAAWLLCNGAAVSRTDFADLFAVLGSTYGAGDGSTTFNLPDLRGRVPIGAGTGAQNGGSGTGAISGGTALTNRTRGAFAGDERLQSHAHDGTITTNVGGVGGPTDAVPAHNATPAAAQPWRSQVSGAGTGQNMPPFIVTNYLIKT
jgi:microcystin-dependent protein